MSVSLYGTYPVKILFGYLHLIDAVAVAVSNIGSVLKESLLDAAAAVAATWPAAGQLATFEKRTAGLAIAELLVERTGSEQYRLTLTRVPSGRMQVFHVDGSEWRLRLSTLDWSGIALDLGPAPGYRLERLESRGTPASAGGTGRPGTAYDLADGRARDPWPQLWHGPEWARVIRLREFDGRILGDRRPGLRDQLLDFTTLAAAFEGWWRSPASHSRCAVPPSGSQAKGDRTGNLCGDAWSGRTLAQRSTPNL